MSREHRLLPREDWKTLYLSDELFEAMKIPKPTKRKETLASLKRGADKYFSLWLRQSNADDRGLVECITCGKKYPVATIQCGHFVRRQYLPTRWEPKNCAPQCFACNVWRRGEVSIFAVKLQQKYGKGILDWLNEKRTEPPLRYLEVKEIRDKYKQLFKELCTQTQQ